MMRWHKLEGGQDVAEWDAYVRRWKRRTTALAVLFVISIGGVIPFLAGNPLHRYFDQGKWLIYVACCLLTLVTGSAALTYNFERHLRQLKRQE